MRLINWETNLNNYIESMSNAPFVWGVSDCCNFANGAIKSITGDYVKIGVEINSEKDALNYIKNNGDVEEIADNYLDRKDVLYASRGDIVSAFVDGKRIGLGVCMGDYAAFKTADGITRKPINEFLNAWSVD